MNTHDDTGRSTPARDDVFGTLANDDRRAVLRIVSDRSPTGLTKSDLAYELAAVTADKPLAEVTDGDHQRALVACHHRTLPALFDAGLLAETDDGRVVTTGHWVFDDDGIAAVLEGRTADHEHEHEHDLDALFSALADERRRTILTVLADQYQPIATEALARDIAAREDDVTAREVSQERVDEVYTSLVHVHLPALSDAALVDYDVETGNVSYEGHPVLASTGSKVRTRARA